MQTQFLETSIACLTGAVPRFHRCIKLGALALLVGALGALSTPQAYAQEFKVGFINTERIFREATTAKTAQSKLEKEFAQREKALVNMSNQLKAQADALERNSVTLSQAQLASRQKELAEKDREFQRTRQAFQEDLNIRKNEELQQILEKANQVVKQIAQSEKYDMVLQEAVYVNPKYDITERVLKLLNANQP
jgi:outer membrane protein